ncbi:MAG: DUF2975 domain-containing protein [Lachnospiraceae bacterium]|nr:DUF2975 domain-containing protein [Lachnospiraceae bacterium]
MENKKFIKSATIIDRILKIVQGFMVAGVIISIIFIILAFVAGDKIIADTDDSGLNTLTIGVVNLELQPEAEDLVSSSNVITFIVVMLICLFVSSIITWFIMKNVRDIIAPMKEGNPFSKGTAAKIKKLAIVVFLGDLVVTVAQIVTTIFELRAFNIEQLFDSSVVKHIGYNINIGFEPFIIALILLFLSYIFSYGEELQRESDETL